MKKTLLSFFSFMVGSLITVNAQFVVFGDALVPVGAQLLNAGSGAVNTITDGQKFTGTSAIQISYAGSGATATWAMAYIIVATGAAGVDLREYTDGYLNFAMKTTSFSTFNIRITDGSIKPKIVFSSDADPYGFVRGSEEWQKISIPIADFLALTPTLNMAAIKEFFVWRSGATDGTTGWFAAEASDFYVDDISISKTPWSTTGVKNTGASTINVYPNPVKGVLHVNGVKSLQAKIYSITGQLVESVNQASNQLNVAGLRSGVYFISGKSDGKSYVQKFIVK
jgi:hypothetical protein